MDSQIAKLGTSLLVPSVHELAKQPMTKVPERYVRLNQDPVVSDTISLPQVPVIDLNKLLTEDETELEKLNQACKEWGFFQLKNHGVNPSLVQNVKIGVQEFFSLPMEEKKKFRQKQGDMEGYGQNFVVSEEQKLEWADMFYISTLPSYTRNPHIFPSIPQPFRNDLESYSLELEKLCTTIINVMTKALKIESKELLELFEDLSQSIRMNCYPPCPQPEHVIGLNPHSDAGALTILLQANEMEGLQIRKDGMWIPIKPLSNAFVINVGDILEILTNGIYRSIEHRATINSNMERISIATFHRPQMNRIVGPTQSLITPERPAQFKRIGVADYYRRYFSRELQGKSCLDVVRIKDA
ncbi:Protein SRG1, partial [Mucuna pruriens]